MMQCRFPRWMGGTAHAGQIPVHLGKLWGITQFSTQREITIPSLAITSGLLFASVHKLKIFMPSS